MKLKRLELHRWDRWKDGSHEVIPVDGGVIVDYRMTEVNNPFVAVLRGKQRTVFDVGYRWVYFTPLAAKHTVIVAFDECGVPLQVYVDVTQANHLDPDGFPVIQDIYLDVLAWIRLGPDGAWLLDEPEIIDQDELDAALDAGEITLEQHAAAWAEARHVADMLRGDAFPALETVRWYVLGSLH